MRVRSGRPCSSSSACAATPIARKNAAIPTACRSVWKCGARRGADRDVRQMPERVRRVEKRDVVAPAAAAERVPGGLTFFLRPHVTIPPPRESRLARTSSMPAVAPRLEEPRQRPLCVVIPDRRAEERADLVPAVADQPSRARKPGANPQLPRRSPEPRGDAELEPRHHASGRTTRASSRSVVAGSST